jgi:hypothetical protein
MKQLLVLSTALTVGCGLSCTEMYVPSGFALDLEASSWLEGLYEIELSGDVEALCAVTLPAPSAVIWEPCDVDGVEMSYDEHALREVFMRDPLPEYVHVTVLLDGVELAAQAFEPRYESTEPNGPGCGESVNANDELSLD